VLQGMQHLLEPRHSKQLLLMRQVSHDNGCHA